MTAFASIRVGLALALVAAALGGCAGLNRAVGAGKNPPDEFAIATKAPLVVPPDYALRPPRPGEARPAEMTPAQRAQQLLLGDGAAAAPTPGEQLMLQKSNALLADPNIRAVLDAENGGRAEKDRSFANQLIFWRFVGGEVDDSAAPLRVDNPEEWFEARERAIRAAIGENAKVTISRDGKTLNLPGVR